MPEPREIVLRYAGECRKCGRHLPVGAAAMYESGAGVSCISCPVKRGQPPSPPRAQDLYTAPQDEPDYAAQKRGLASVLAALGGRDDDA